MSGINHDPSTYHSHKAVYLKTAAVLTVVTACEIGILFVPALKFAYVPMLTVMAMYKFAVVVGTFMHLKDDKNVFRFVFLTPVLMAFAMIYVLGLLVMPHFGALGEGYVRLANDKTYDERMGEGDFSPAALAARNEKPPHLSKAKYTEMFTSTTDFGAGKKIFAAKCAVCHRPDGGGLVGPNMTDDCYLYGGDVHSMVRTITNGKQAKGMLAFKATLSETDIDNVALFVRSLRGKTVAKGKACQGDKVATK